MNWIETLTAIGQAAVPIFWLPLLLWTVITLFMFGLGWRFLRQQPQRYYQACMALIIALPAGLLISPLVHLMPGTVQFSLILPAADIAIPKPVYSDLMLDATPPGFSSTSGAIGDIDIATDKKPVVLEQASATTMVRPVWSAYTMLGGITVLAGLLGLFGIIRLLFQVSALNMLRQQLNDVKEHHALEMLNGLKAGLEINKTVVLKYAGEGSGPMTFGIRRPVIAIPADVIAVPATLRTVLQHELVHINRNDFAWGLGVRLIQHVFAFHALVHVIARELSIYREILCDADTLRNREIERGDYARLLLQFGVTGKVAGAIPMVQRKSTLKQRIEIMTHQDQLVPSTDKSRLFFAMIFLLPVLLVACVDTEHQEDPVDDVNIVQLEAKVAYLRAELDGMLPALNAKRPDPEEPDFEVKMENWQKENEYLQFYRRPLLVQMLQQQLKVLETAKMEMVVAGL